MLNFKGLPTDLKLAEVFLIGANAEQPVIAGDLSSNAVQIDGVEYIRLEPGVDYDGTLDVILTRLQIDNIGQDGNGRLCQDHRH